MANDLDVLRDRVALLETPAACEQFAKNVEANGKPEAALLARKRAIELRARSHGVSSAAEVEALEAVYAYERTLFLKHGKNVRASRTWRMIKDRGVIPSVERVVTRPGESSGYTELCKLGLQDKAFEAVVLRYPGLFSTEAIRRSKQRLQAAK
ncbi:MAG: hypothetical protein ACF8LK_08825 [Phycisphaerales bacterium JB041]